MSDPGSNAQSTGPAADNKPTDDQDAATGDEASEGSPVVRTALGALRAMLGETREPTFPDDAPDSDEPS